MQTFYLTRHGQVHNPDQILYGRLPLPLSTAGRLQIEKMADWYRDKDIKKIYSSPIVRCLETSQILANKLGLEIITDIRLAESLEPVQGMTVEMQRQYDVNKLSYGGTWGGETIEEIFNRVHDFFEEVKSKEKDNIIICSHGDQLLAFLCLIGGCHKDNFLAKHDSAEYQPKGSLRPLEISEKPTFKSIVNF